MWTSKPVGKCSDFAACTTYQISSPVHLRAGSQVSLRSNSVFSLSTTIPPNGKQRRRNRNRLVMSVATEPKYDVSVASEPKYDMFWWKRGGPINMREIRSLQELENGRINAGEKLVVVIFYGTWCRSCRVLHPKLCKLAEENRNIVFLKVNVEENRSLSTDLNVKILPFFHFYRGQEGLLDAFSCSLTKFQKLRNAVQLHSSKCSSAETLAMLESNFAC